MQMSKPSESGTRLATSFCTASCTTKGSKQSSVTELLIGCGRMEGR